MLKSVFDRNFVHRYNVLLCTSVSIVIYFEIIYLQKSQWCIFLLDGVFVLAAISSFNL